MISYEVISCVTLPNLWKYFEFSHMYILNVKVQGHVILFTQLTIVVLLMKKLHYIVMMTMTLTFISPWPCCAVVDTAWFRGAGGQYGTGRWQWEHQVRGQARQAPVPVRLRLYQKRGRSTPQRMWHLCKVEVTRQAPVLERLRLYQKRGRSTPQRMWHLCEVEVTRQAPVPVECQQ